MRVYVLLYNARSENEGIHSLQIGDRNTVLMFQSEEDATRYALLLEAQDFPTPTVEGIDLEEVEDFCNSAGYDCQLVTEDMLAVPPETNLEETLWNQDSPSDADMSATELDRIRRRLEGLL